MCKQINWVTLELENSSYTYHEYIWIKNYLHIQISKLKCINSTGGKPYKLKKFRAN